VLCCILVVSAVVLLVHPCTCTHDPVLSRGFDMNSPHWWNTYRANHSVTPTRDECIFSATPAPDGCWLEVRRSSTAASRCFRPGQSYNEGVSTGFPGDNGAYYSQHTSLMAQAGAAADRLWPYGCWFDVHANTGVFVNVGRSIRFESKDEALWYFGLMTRTGKAIVTFPDKLLCSFAILHGYDTMQLVRSASTNERTEFVVCSGGCIEQPVAGGCAPIPLARRVNGSVMPCNCVENGCHLNCA
jgi:hypothetical protein